MISDATLIINSHLNDFMDGRRGGRREEDKWGKGGGKVNTVGIDRGRMAKEIEERKIKRGRMGKRSEIK